MKYLFLEKIIHKLSHREESGESDGDLVCKKCGEKLGEAELKENLYVCPHCGYHFRISAFVRVKMLADGGIFKEYFSSLETSNPLDFPGYAEKIEKYMFKTGLKEAVVTGTCRINGFETVLVVMDPNFMMGSMGSVVGEKITRSIMLAVDLNLPVVIFTASGGARMQEGIFSLFQMAKTSAALLSLEEKSLPYIVVLTDPTTGGVTASFAMLGDIIISEPGALIGFAGPRVIEGTIKQKLPEGFQSAEFQLEKGFVDMVVKRKDLKDTLSFLLKIHRYGRGM